MKFPSLNRQSILVVEDEALIAYDLTMALEAEGASVTSTNTVRHALILIEHDGLAAAIIDHALSDGESTLVRARLKERGIPYVAYSGFETSEAGCVHIGKPATPEMLMEALEKLLNDRPVRIS